MRKSLLLVVCLIGLLSAVGVGVLSQTSPVSRADISNKGNAATGAPLVSAHAFQGEDCCECKGVVQGRYCFNNHCGNFTPDQRIGCGYQFCQRRPLCPCSPGDCQNCCTQFQF